MVDRALVHSLQEARDFPSVSLLVPVGDGPEGRLQGPPRLKNLLRSATERLAKELPGRDVRPVLDRLQRLAGSVDFWRAPRGIALFASPSQSLQVDLPVTVRERVVIDETFATRDLVRALAGSVRYRMLVVGEDRVRLLEGERDRASEVTSGGFTMTLAPPEAGARPRPVDRALRERRRGRDEPVLRLFRRAKDALDHLDDRESLPIVLVGVDRQLARFERLLGEEHAIVARFAGSHATTEPMRLAALVWPAVARRIEGARKRVALQAVTLAGKAGKLATGLVECWHMAHEGRGAHLVVEEGFHAAADPGPAPGLIAVTDGSPGRIDDAIDELVETVQGRGGRVTFVPDGSLEAHGRSALVLRY